MQRQFVCAPGMCRNRRVFVCKCMTGRNRGGHMFHASCWQLKLKEGGWTQHAQFILLNLIIRYVLYATVMVGTYYYTLVKTHRREEWTLMWTLGDNVVPCGSSVVTKVPSDVVYWWWGHHAGVGAGPYGNSALCSILPWNYNCSKK